MEDVLRVTSVQQELQAHYHARSELTILILVKKAALFVQMDNIVRKKD